MASVTRWHDRLFNIMAIYCNENFPNSTKVAKLRYLYFYSPVFESQTQIKIKASVAGWIDGLFNFGHLKNQKFAQLHKNAKLGSKSAKY